MKIVLAQDAPQQSDAWKELRIGRVTASQFHKVVTPARLELSKQRHDLCFRKAAERLLRESFDPILDGLPYVELGKEEEQYAVKAYTEIAEAQFDERPETYAISFIVADDERMGCSPDRLVLGNDRHGLEVKCLFPPTMAEYHLVGTGADHRVQMLGQFLVGQFEINDFFAYNEVTRPFIKRWLRAEVKDDIATVAGHLDRFCDELDEATDKLRALGFYTKRGKEPSYLDTMVRNMTAEFMPFTTIADLDRWREDPLTVSNIGNLPADRREELLGRFDLRRQMMAGATP